MKKRGKSVFPEQNRKPNRNSSIHVDNNFRIFGNSVSSIAGPEYYFICMLCSIFLSQ